MPEQSREALSLPRTGLSVEGRELVVISRGRKDPERHSLEDIADVEMSVRWDPVGFLLAFVGFAFTFAAPLLFGRVMLRWVPASCAALAIGLLSMRKGHVAIATKRREVRRAARDPFDECGRFVARLRRLINEGRVR